MLSPDIHGAHRRKSLNIFQDLLNYDVDSDDEWEEEEPGESLSNSEVFNQKLFFVYNMHKNAQVLTKL